jgi:hypothetical protein
MGSLDGGGMRPILRIVFVSAALTMGMVPCSFAQDTTPTSDEFIPGLPVGGWLLYPSIFAGAVYNDNINQAPQGTDKQSGTTARVSPRVVATYNGGIYQTTLYGVVDAQFFNADTLAANAGFTYSYSPREDLTFGLWGNYTRQTDIFNNAAMFDNNAIGPTGNPPNTIPVIINPYGNTPYVNPIAYNQFAGGGSVTKNFGQAFATLGANAYYLVYDHNFDNTPPPIQTSHDGGSYWLSGRVGYRFPAFYVFAEADGIWQGFNNSIFNSDGYRVIGGVGSDNPDSLWQFEVYGGYQYQRQPDQNSIPSGVPAVPASTDSGVFGGTLTYHPTPYWTLIAQVNEVLGVSTFPVIVTPAGVPNAGIPNLATTAILQTTYGLSRLWSIGARVGYTRADYIGFDRLDDGWMAGASFNYEIRRNWQLTLDYQYREVNSNLALSDFRDNQYTAGLTYRY